MVVVGGAALLGGLLSSSAELVDSIQVLEKHQKEKCKLLFSSTLSYSAAGLAGKDGVELPPLDI